MEKRVRKRANLKFCTSTTPTSRRRSAAVRDGILNGDRRMKSALEDCEPQQSQEAYEICEDIVKTPFKSN